MTIGRRLRVTLAVSGLALALGGSLTLDLSGRTGPGFLLLGVGAILLVLQRDAPPEPDGPVRPGWTWIALLATASIVLTVLVVRGVLGTTKLGPFPELALWALAGLACVAAFHLADLRCGAAPGPGQGPERLFERADWLWAAGLFLLAAAARLPGLGVEPPGLNHDEAWPIERTLLFGRHPEHTGFFVDDMSMSGLFHAVSLLGKAIGPVFGLELVPSVKLPWALGAALSVGLTFLVVRLFAPRATAAAAGVLLVFLGQHWALSRFYYLYAGDLLFLAATTLCILAGLKARRLSLVAAAGFLSAVGATWPKTSALLAPWCVAILAERFLFERGDRVRARLLPAAVWLLPFLLGIAPLVAQIRVQPAVVWRFSDVSKIRQDELKRLGMSSGEAYLKGAAGTARVLFVSNTGLVRHRTREAKPELDPVFSVLVVVGLLVCLRALPGERQARLCLGGLVLFVWPAIGSYPAELEGQLGIVLARRLAGAWQFLAWIAALGAAAAAARLVRERLRPFVTVGLAVASTVLSFGFLRAHYGKDPYQWHNQMGIGRVHAIHALRRAAAGGRPVYFQPTYFTSSVASGVADLPNVVAVSTPEQLRQGLLSQPGKQCAVLLPWPAGGDDAAFPAAVADLIPAEAWIAGPPDLAGLPVYRLAFVKVPTVPPVPPAPPASAPPKS